MTPPEVVSTLLVVVLVLVADLRWWRVAQREHYGPGRLLAMTRIWLRAVPMTWIGVAAMIVTGLAGLTAPPGGPLAALVLVAWPPGLALWKASKKLAFTARVKRLVAISVAVQLVAAMLLSLVGAVSLLPLLAVPLLELALLIAQPVEARLAARWQVSAAEKIKRVDPRVVAITGSYGKTSTKNYVTHLLQGRWSTLASPASFNNVLGLSRAVNDRLEPGTDVFVAEMGTYGPGEIASLCEIFRPEVSAITTIGEAHLERMKTRETIVRAKSEILPPASTVVLNVDVPELAEIAARLRSEKRVIAVSAGEQPDAEVVVRKVDAGWELVLDGTAHPVRLPADVGHPTNVAVAVGLALALDVPEKTILDRLPGIPATPHRAEATTGADGVAIIDDTFNSNPTGAARALAHARELAGETGRVWTITPGMMELGHHQAERNAALAVDATSEARSTLCVVGRTNTPALLAGEKERTKRFASREAATAWVRKQARAGDVILFENDLPDHYP
ncbi:UDP-N-acetylmuramoyl-tripeptide--D-alanyl-D-alanine ligase [Nocardioides sp. GY 10127]|uniref:Mur ligase family protein n=1 Tax=Nocardioides sp. GY 10127 TaxID=2569762 RepID=UPI0010A8F290|nr:UDP-N-acetylmuramoyl-tripeptide--D-alanyl-D-alanine ligase [Nocardioides sp. GY 10127]TIC80820.1 UDP-N-acetylmuramoyl-tripeptide--D-alanyl-D-alanine ligase [Nocardioides sp. GY 10127]